MQTKRYLIAGLGKTGHSIARYLQRHGHDFAIFDTREHPTGVEAFRLEFPDTEVFLACVPDTAYVNLEAVITSPGVPLTHAVFEKANALNLPIYGDIECFARVVSAPVVAITGTNGKSTVTSLVHAMAREAGRNVALGGNIGNPVLDLLDDGMAYDLWVLELSSFQLDLTTSLAPIAATILNVSPDHLDRHGTLEAYVQAKQSIYKQARTCIYHREDASTLPVQSAGTCISFGLSPAKEGDFGLLETAQGLFLSRGVEPFLNVDSMRIKGRHNWENALAACALAETAGIPLSYCIEVLRHFSGLPHRSQWLRTLNGVDYINDSKGTNVGATRSALSGLGASIQGKIVLIAGGQGKGADFHALTEPLASYVRSVVLMGEDASCIAKAIEGVVPVLHATSLAHAVTLASLEAQSGDTVLLSPACASFDMFRDFNHRGECFADIVGAL